MIRVGIVGLGKMGLSHLSMFNAHPDFEVAGICDSTGYLLSILDKYTGVDTYTSLDRMIEKGRLDAVVVATPSSMHAGMVRTALGAGLHVFCEKPFCLDVAESLELTEIAEGKGLVTQVGYHYRYVGAFQEVKRLLDAQAVGRVTHVLAEAYGPVVLRPRGGTWRSQKNQGGGSLYDYAAHPLNLVNWYLGEPSRATGTVLNPIFSRETDDEVYGTLHFDSGVSASLSVNWSDESHRKMSTKITLWGTEGKIVADRQEVQVYLREEAVPPPGYAHGWNVKYTTELTDEVWFYVRGEEYSAQVDDFAQRILTSNLKGVNSFSTALETDRSLAMMIADASEVRSSTTTRVVAPTASRRLRLQLPWCWV